MSLHARLYAEKNLRGLWPHGTRAEAAQAAALLDRAGLSADDAAPGSPGVVVRLTVAYWQSAADVHGWLEKRHGYSIEDSTPAWLDREVLVELREHATVQLLTDP